MQVSRLRPGGFEPVAYGLEGPHNVFSYFIYSYLTYYSVKVKRVVVNGLMFAYHEFRASLSEPGA